MVRTCARGLAAAWLTSAAACLAQANAQVPLALSLDRGLVTGHYDTDLGTTDAASAGTVEGAALQDIPIQRPAQVLETVPGLVVTQHSGDGKANQYFLRGYNLDHGTDLASFVDGVPVNMPTNAHGQGYTDLNFVIPELVDHIDYRKGPYYTQYGDFASAGAIDIHYLDQLDSSLANVTFGEENYKRVLVAASCQYGASGCTEAGSADRSQSLSGPRVLGAFEYLQENGPWTEAEHLHKLNGLLRVTDGSDATGWSLDAIAYSAHWDSTDQVPLALIESGQLGRFAALDPTDGGDSGRAVISGEWHFASDSSYTKAAVYLEHYRLQLWSDFTYFELRPATGDQFEQQENRNMVGASLTHGWTSNPFGWPSSTEVGLQVRHDNIDVGLFNSEQRHVFETVSNEDVSESEAAVYAQNTTWIFPWFKATLGVREDLISLDAYSLSTPANSGNADAGKLSPKMALVFGPWYRTEFFVDAGKGFHSNDARGVIDKIDPTDGLAYSAVPALVGSLGKELGVRTTIIAGLQSSLALWTLASDSELVYDADSAVGSFAPNAASKRRGMEWNNHAVIGTHVLIDLDVAATHARFAQDNQNGELGDHIPNAVGKVGVFRATMQNYGPWTFGLETRYIGPYPLSQDGALANASSTVTNVRLQYAISRKTSLFLDVLNVFDKQYYDIAYEQDYRVSPTAPIVPEGVTVHPGEPREVRLTLSTAL